VHTTSNLREAARIARQGEPVHYDGPLCPAGVTIHWFNIDEDLTLADAVQMVREEAQEAYDQWNVDAG
jgi:hypothetical protein